MKFAKMAVALAFCTLVASLGGGCEREQTGGHAAEPPTPGSRPEHCPKGAERYVEGRVRVPVVSGSTASGDAGDSGVRGALRRTRPVSGADVEIYRNGGGKVETGGRTSTDAKGRWCLEWPREWSFSTDMTAEATFDDTTLRRSVVAGRGQHLSVRTEALHRILSKRELSGELARARYLNLVSVAATAADLTNPPSRDPSASTEERIERVREAMLGDERFRRLLDR